MIDTSGFEERKKRDEEVQNMIQQIMNMPHEELQEKFNIITGALETLMPYAEEIHERLSEGEILSSEELQTLDECEKAAKRASDFIILARKGLMNRMTAQADTLYYAVKQEAENGNVKAQEIFERLRVIKQNAIRETLDDSCN